MSATRVKDSSVMTKRISEHPIEPIFLDRWSPRAYDAGEMPAVDLLTILEAARWAPSAYNIQPWRFLYSLRGDKHWQDYLDLLDTFNQSWAHHASALVFILSDSIDPNNDNVPKKTSRCHSFDAGAAWAQLALQATALGYQAHGMAGIDYDQSRLQLCVPEHCRVEIAVAIGTRDEPSILPRNLQDREYPSQRLPLNEIAFAGLFPQ